MCLLCREHRREASLGRVRAPAEGSEGSLHAVELDPGKENVEDKDPFLVVTSVPGRWERPPEEMGHSEPYKRIMFRHATHILVISLGGNKLHFERPRQWERTFPKRDQQMTLNSSRTFNLLSKGDYCRLVHFFQACALAFHMLTEVR